MPKRDYVSARKRRAKSKSKGAGRALLITFVVMLAAISGFAGGYFVDKSGSQPETGQEDKSIELLIEIEQLREQIQTMRQEVGKQKQSAKKADTDVGELNFYRELPKQSVTPEPVVETSTQAMQDRKVLSQAAETKKSEKPVQAHKKKHKTVKKKSPPGIKNYFRIQVASLSSASAAAKLEKKLSGWGLNPAVKKVKVSGYGWRYRVYAGPYKSRKDANEANLLITKKLKKMGIILSVK
ncbi:MAG: SPOR domain-containing protein [Mariprofundaceae bacterium]